MSYKVLYRKYRPANFNDVVDQQAIVKILQNSIINNKISHAYLFAGPRGTGKTSMARIFAKAINCENPQDGNACGKCRSCLNFAESPDIIEIDAASNNGVNEIRELINNVKIMPAVSKYKVYIIDEVHMLSVSAFNALLLTLEEPPSHVIFILATTNIESVPITIISRCQKYEFYRISDELITQHLQKICDSEKIAYDYDGLKEITELSDGGLRDALSMLDQLSKENEKLTLDLVVRELGSISLVKIKEIIKALENKDYQKIDAIINEFKKSNLNYKIVVKKLVELLSKEAIQSLENNNLNQLDYKIIKNIILELNDCLNRININVNPYIIIEMILLNYCGENKNDNVKNDTKIEEKHDKTIKIIDENENINEDVSNKNNFIKKNIQNNNLQEIKEIRINNCFVAPDKEILNSTKEKWSKFLLKINSQLRGLISDTYPVAASKEYVIICSEIDHLVDEINENNKKIEKEYLDYLKDEIKIVALSLEEWQKEKKKYIQNKQEGKKYIYKEEDIKKEEQKDLEEFAKDIFTSDKLEIK